MKKITLIICLLFSANAAKADVAEFFIAIKLDMQMGRGLSLDASAKKIRNNNAERVMQYIAGKTFDNLKDCEGYLMDDLRKTAEMEFYADYAGFGFVWNNYANDNKTIVQQWRCLKVLQIGSLKD